MPDRTLLAGRRALVTGANGGIGRVIAGALANAGATTLRHRPGPEGSSDGTDWLDADFLKSGGARDLARDALADGTVDILIACAAIEARRPWTEVDDASIAEHVAANFASLLTLCRILIPGMTARGWGRVIAIGSVMASRPRAETVVYAALKAAQKTALAAIAREVAAQGVTINLVSPGAIETDSNAARYADPDFRRAVVAKIPAGRPGRPEDVLAPILMLCGDAAGYITGADIAVDGGWTLGDAPGSLPEAPP